MKRRKFLSLSVVALAAPFLPLPTIEELPYTLHVETSFNSLPGRTLLSNGMWNGGCDPLVVVTAKFPDDSVWVAAEYFVDEEDYVGALQLCKDAAQRKYESLTPFG